MHRRTSKRCCSHTHKRAHTHVFYISIATSPIFYPIFPFLLSFLLLFALFSDCLYSLWVKIYFSIVSTCSRWPNCRIPDSGPTFQANSWRARCVSVLFGCFFEYFSCSIHESWQRDRRRVDCAYCPRSAFTPFVFTLRTTARQYRGGLIVAQYFWSKNCTAQHSSCWFNS